MLVKNTEHTSGDFCLDCVWRGPRNLFLTPVLGDSNLRQVGKHCLQGVCKLAELGTETVSKDSCFLFAHCCEIC